MNENEIIDTEARVYELGYHLVPTIAEEAVVAEVAALKALILKEGGEVISEVNPKVHALVYEISKTVKSIKTRYNRSYFGSIKFAVTSEGVLKIKKALDEQDNIIRYLLIGSSKDEEVNEEELDKTIDQLVIN